MPCDDRTGPRGEGSKSGRVAGYCSGSPTPGFVTGTPQRQPATQMTPTAGVGASLHPLPKNQLERIAARITELEQGGAR